MIEQLEHRNLFAITVTQDLPGYYNVQGDGTELIIDVTQPADFDHTGSFTIRGGATYNDVNFIRVLGTAGRDRITVNSSTGPVGVSIGGFEDADDLFLSGPGRIDGNEGDDIITMVNGERAEVHGGEGDDYIIISGNTWPDSEIHADGGKDQIHAENNWYGLVLNGDDGNDYIWGTAFNDEIRAGGGTANFIYAGAGDDIIHATNGSVDWLTGGAGYDTVYSLDGNDYLIGVESLILGN